MLTTKSYSFTFQKSGILYFSRRIPASSLLIRGWPIKAFKSCGPKLSDALEKYCRLKGVDRAEFFKSASSNQPKTTFHIWLHYP